MSWKCPVCDTYNDDSSDSCMVCGAGRPESAAAEHWPEPEPGKKVTSEAAGLSGKEYLRRAEDARHAKEEARRAEAERRRR
ncbi:MAG: hypothetical protein IJT16_04775, partial [Lachnospiraceae bacterium]|nr:hypothetical protein [Lachnospiraceae bacterium]